MEAMAERWGYSGCAQAWGVQRRRRLSKEPIPLDDDEEQVDYENDDIDAYLIEPGDASFDNNVSGSSYKPDDDLNFKAIGEAIPTLFLMGSHFEPMDGFEGASGD
ncbi:uncharacterized protein A4U43_C04F28010 [Asparagus officinalis]|uniref:Uncharacterized protein n=1 Tax=Asparagus officinalis TaxID=4686 RepID=A0A5P1F946_ASPOF|nr:uncharacterized protein A4U43_C04F28010 [Asparagus officinalis]